MASLSNIVAGPLWAPVLYSSPATSLFASNRYPNLLAIAPWVDPMFDALVKPCPWCQLTQGRPPRPLRPTYGWGVDNEATPLLVLPWERLQRE